MSPVIRKTDDVAVAGLVDHPHFDSHVAGPRDRHTFIDGEDARSSDGGAPVRVALSAVGARARALDCTPVVVEPTLPIGAGMRPPPRPSAAWTKHPVDLTDAHGWIQPVPSLGEAHEVDGTRTNRERHAVGDDGDEVTGVRARPAKQFAAWIDCNHVSVPSDERSRRDSGPGTNVEHAQPVKRAERIEDLIRI